jgi:hypothetical protein
MPKYSWTFRLLCIPVAEAVVVAAAFMFQGGFGGGHGPLDRLFIIQYSGIAVVEHLPDSVASHLNDFVLVVLIPFSMNILCFAFCGITIDTSIWLTGKRRRCGMEVCVRTKGELK